MNIQIPLSSFKKNPDGSWSPIQSIMIGNITVSPGMNFRKGVLFNGLDIVDELEKHQ